MKKVIWLLLVIMVSGGGLAGFVQAQNGALNQEAVSAFTSKIVVNIDNSIDVTETIVYNTGPQERHGIHRDIYSYSSQKRQMNIANVLVTDENNKPYPFQISSSSGNKIIKIGDPNKTFSGQKTYVIRYHATDAVGQLKDLDEIYWNVTGNAWGMPIYQVNASVSLPAGAKLLQSACYYGPAGSTSQCPAAQNQNDSYLFKGPSVLNAYDGLTIAAGFPKGIVPAYPVSSSSTNFIDLYWPWLVSALLPILTLVGSFFYWFKKGRDPRGTGVIIPQYDVPDELTPIEVSGIVSEKVQVENISAEIIYLATKGYLKINQLEEKFIGLIKMTDYELVRLKDFSDLPNDFDQQLLRGLFNPATKLKLSDLKSFILRRTIPAPTLEVGAQLKSVKLSELRNIFSRYVSGIITAALDALLNKNYYQNLGRMKTGANPIGLILFMAFWSAGFLGGFGGLLFFRGNTLPLMAGIFVSVIIYGIFSYFSPAKTAKGVATKEYLLGLKEYLQIAEKDRLLFHNAPDKKPEVFEKLLPYAMVLGVAEIWAKEFEGIYVTPPTWYSGPTGPAFSAVAFSHSLNNFSAFASSSLGSSAGGSGGGGSSGGGGGGGGGGGW